MSDPATIILDLHGFQRQLRIAEPAGDLVHVPLVLPLLSPGVRGTDLLEGNEEELSIFSARFRRRGDRWVCAGCALCDPAWLKHAVEPIIAETVRTTVNALMGSALKALRRTLREEIRRTTRRRRN